MRWEDPQGMGQEVGQGRDGSVYDEGTINLPKNVFTQDGEVGTHCPIRWTKST